MSCFLTIAIWHAWHAMLHVTQSGICKKKGKKRKKRLTSSKNKKKTKKDKPQTFTL